jgi:polyphosphate kinase
MPKDETRRERRERRAALVGRKQMNELAVLDVTVPAREAAVLPGADLANPALYLNRELSGLEFNRRVLDEALDATNPLLERVKFLAIVAANLDEFYMVRVAGLKEQAAAGLVDVSPDGMTPAEQLAAVRRVAQELMRQSAACFHDDLHPRLAAAHIQVLDYADLTERQRTVANRYYNEVIFPTLTPLAHDPGRPFPHISNLSLNLAVVVRDEGGEEHFARVRVPSSLPRLVPLKRSSGGVKKDGTAPRDHHFVWIEQLIAANLDSLFPGLTVVEAHPFRVVRDADMDIQELEADDLLETIEESVRQRQFGSLVSMTLNPTMPEAVRDTLAANLGLAPQGVYTLEGPLGLSGLMSLYAVDRHDLKDPPYQPGTPVGLEPRGGRESIFAAIRREDILLHHPYDSFTPVIDFLQAAARDPHVLAIKQTLYRVGRDSPVVNALLEARERGKQVAVLVELKARFDEESNIGWARKLEDEGVHVVYGLLGLKTHSKVALVVRMEGERIRRYVHLATGNYNHATAQMYTDLGLFTVDEDIGADASDLFNYLTGYSGKTDYQKLLVAPINLRQQLEALIEREIAHVRAGRPGRLVFKMNSLVDPGMIRSLYRASQAGVTVELIVRGICCLVPGVPGVSDNIRVISIVGRFLEHSRVYFFENGGDAEVYLGSADLMPRNLDRRVEVMFPVERPALIRHLRDEVLEIMLADNLRARRLLPDGRYERLAPAPGEAPMDSQAWFMRARQGVGGR